MLAEAPACLVVLRGHGGGPEQVRRWTTVVDDKGNEQKMALTSQAWEKSSPNSVSG